MLFAIPIRSVVIAGLLAGLSGAPVQGGPGVIYLPLTFTSETGPILSGACLQVVERNYPATKSWETVDPSADGSERAMEALLTVLKRKDRDALLRLSDPVLGRDPKQFDDQASGYFKQFEDAKITSIPRAFEFGRFVVFFGTLRWAGSLFPASYVFHREENGTFGFLPYGTDELTFHLVLEWVDAPWGPSSSSGPRYCPAASMAKFDFRLSTSTSPSRPIPYLYLRGVPIDSPGQLKALAGSVVTKFQKMKKALATDNWIDTFTTHMDAEGGKRLEDWYRSADERERDLYKQSITEQEPFFVFDASPLVIVYTKSPSHVVQVMYFVSSAGTNLVWTNSSLATTADRVFKSGPLYSAAMLDRPFSSLEIK